jgi:hypothetical protein
MNLEDVFVATEPDGSKWYEKEMMDLYLAELKLELEKLKEI